MILATGCPSLDELLGGGIEQGAITLAYGEAGTGKTNLAIQLARNAVLADQGKVAFVDSEGVSFQRFNQICGKDAPRILKGVLFFAPHDLPQQQKMVRSLDKIKPTSLAVVDSLNMYYRLHLGDDGGSQPTQALTRMLGDLHRFARTRDIPVLATAQVYTDEDTVQPFGGRIMEHIVKSMVRFDRTGPGRRRATLIKHRSQPEGAQCEFRISQEGLVAP